ncbi:ABC transporter ATP-binding protein [Ferrimonas aestuarii]|uniref:ABC transporter ATP-binding protein n=1 Tax=Ferrimonas aestuarii TaxID=2569539 RepID=A0A4U1BNG9_9GAMM|nr:ABC transporter ATP-binding protein [Ferrimonas aestuarii]TKB55463.1 ABC transporter ATP-binding protein [Ferrimonas aestuarii]
MTRGLVVSGLHKTYDNGVSALKGVELEVAPGLYGLLGPNGAGKSTLMRTLATLQRPDSGSIVFDGFDALSQPDKLRQCLGYLPQQIGSYPGVPAQSLLERFAWLKGRTDGNLRRREVAELLEKVNLSDVANRAVSEYSGGMLRRFGIALALIGQPKLVIVDEPTAGLDPSESNRFHRVLADIADDAVVLLSTHIIEDVENLCERLSILTSGRIVASGSPHALTSPLKGRLWSRFYAKGDPLPDSPLRVLAHPRGYRVICEAPQVPGSGFEPHQPTLEDAYHLALRESNSEMPV